MDVRRGDHHVCPRACPTVKGGAIEATDCLSPGRRAEAKRSIQTWVQDQGTRRLVPLGDDLGARWELLAAGDLGAGGRGDHVGALADFQPFECAGVATFHVKQTPSLVLRSCSREHGCRVESPTATSMQGDLGAGGPGRWVVNWQTLVQRRKRDEPHAPVAGGARRHGCQKTKLSGAPTALDVPGGARILFHVKHRNAARPFLRSAARPYFTGEVLTRAARSTAAPLEFCSEMRRIPGRVDGIRGVSGHGCERFDEGVKHRHA